MLKLILIFILIYIIYLKVVLHLSFDLKSFIRKGFKKKDNAYGLFAYCGKQGSGKTYSAFKFIIDRKLQTDCIIVTNVLSFQTFKNTIYFTDINDLIDWTISYCDKLPEDVSPNIVIFFDEIFTILEKGTKINKKILSFISQLRKRKIILSTTAQEWLEVNITFRRYVRYQIDAKMISMPFTNTAILINSVNDGEQLKWDKDQNEYIAPRLSTKISKGNLSIVQAYDTYETIGSRYFKYVPPIYRGLKITGFRYIPGNFILHRV